MSILLRKFKRAKKKAAKFCFNIACKELVLECAPKWRPEKVVVAFMHRRRRQEITPRRPEWGFERPTCALIAWPEDALDPLLLTTTLFRDHEQYDDKDWTLVVEEVTAKGKHRPLAAISINVRLFITELPGTRMEAKFKLRPLRKEVQLCTLQLDISSKLLREGNVNDEDLQSLASSVSNQPTERTALKTEIDARLETSTPSDQVVNDIVKVSEEIKRFAGASVEDEQALAPVIPAVNQETSQRAEDLDRRTPSVEEEENPPTPPSHVQYRKIAKPTPQTLASSNVASTRLDEPLINWCARVAEGYKNTTVRDFTKSFKSGLAFCAIIHRYRPDLIGDFLFLDFSDTLGAHKANCKKAFAAAEKLGIKTTLDESVVTLPDRAQIQKFLDMLRFVLEGGIISNGSDSNRQSTLNNHRNSSIYGLSEGEVTLLSDFEFMMQSRLQESEIDSTGISSIGDEMDAGILYHSTPRNIDSSPRHMDPSVELHTIFTRLSDIDRLDSAVMISLTKTMPGSAAEKKLIEQHLNYLNEKDNLVRRQDEINQKLSY